MNTRRARFLRKAIRADTMEVREEIKTEAIKLLVDGYRTKWLVTLYGAFCIAIVAAWGWVMYWQAAS